MLKRRFLVAVFVTVVVLGIGATASAQVNATLVLRSGERLSGRLIDMGAAGFEIEVNGVNRRIREADVAVIDFIGGTQALPEAEIAALQAGSHLVVLRAPAATPALNVQHGILYDIGGRSPLNLTFKTAGGEKTFTSSEVGRIYLARPTGVPAGSAVATTGQAPTTPLPAVTPPPGAITVAANTQWTHTGLVVRKGDMVSFSTIGQIQLSTDDKDRAGPAGSFNGRMAAAAPLPANLAGALIARVGDSAPFPIGDQTNAIPMPAGGQLFLGINDDFAGDNAGQFYVTINRQTRR